MSESLMLLVYKSVPKEWEHRQLFRNPPHASPDNYVPTEMKFRMPKMEIVALPHDYDAQERIKERIFDRLGNGDYELRMAAGGPGGNPKDDSRKAKYRQDKKYGFAKPCGFIRILRLSVRGLIGGGDDEW